MTPEEEAVHRKRLQEEAAEKKRLRQEEAVKKKRLVTGIFRVWMVLCIIVGVILASIVIVSEFDNPYN